MQQSKNLTWRRVGDDHKRTDIEMTQQDKTVGLIDSKWEKGWSDLVQNVKSLSTLANFLMYVSFAIRMSR